MMDRKIWKGDLLNLAAGNSFWRDELVAHPAGLVTATYDSEPGDPIVRITGGYIVKRSDLSELSENQVRIATLEAEITYAGLRGNSREDCERFAAELKEVLEKESR